MHSLYFWTNYLVFIAGEDPRLKERQDLLTRLLDAVKQVNIFYCLFSLLAYLRTHHCLSQTILHSIYLNKFLSHLSNVMAYCSLGLVYISSTILLSLYVCRYYSFEIQIIYQHLNVHLSTFLLLGLFLSKVGDQNNFDYFRM